MRSSLPKAALLIVISLSARSGTAHAASIRVSGPAVISPGVSYSLYVEAENTGLGGVPTDGIQWMFAAPSFLASDFFGRPSSGDFYSTDEGTPIATHADLFTDPVLPGASSLRFVDVPGAGPVDRSFASAYIRLVEYRLQIAPNPASPLPLNDDFVLTFVDAVDPDANSQFFSNLTPVLSFDIRLSRADFDRNTRVNEADTTVFGACVTGPNIPYDLNNLSAGCACGVVSAGGMDYLRADFDNDGDVDQDDFGKFQTCFAGDELADVECGNDLLPLSGANARMQTVSAPLTVPQAMEDSQLKRLVRLRNSGVLLAPLVSP